MEVTTYLNPFKIFLKLIELFQSFSVARAVALSFGMAIIWGSLILYVTDGREIGYINSLYLSASAFCVTGLSPVNISDMSILGQIAIMLFIKMGGLGIIVFTVLIGVLVIRGLSRNTKLQEFVFEVLDANVEEEKRIKEEFIDKPKVVRIIIAIFNIAITIELVGAVILYFTFPEVLPRNVTSRVFLSLFTSISAFNNAGFSLSNDISFVINDPISLTVIMILVILGGIGFPVIIFIEKLFLKALNRFASRFEIWCETHLMTKSIKGEEPSAFYFFLTKLSLKTEYRIEEYNKSLLGESNHIQTRVILLGSLVLILIGSICFFFLERTNEKTISDLSLSSQIMNSLLISISSRTAGFSTIDLAGMKDASVIIISSLMFIGGGPQGTAGGIKITTFVILMQYLKNVINSQSKVAIFGHLVSKRSVAMSIRLYFLATTTLAGMIFLLAISHQKEENLTRIFFEVISAFSTVGFSMDFTNKISDVEKVIYSFLMYVGRIGVFTVLVSITQNSITGQMGEEDDGVKIQVG